MAYTSTDLANVQAAVTALATGTRKVSVRFSDGKSVEYAQVQLPDLMRLRDQIQAEVSSAAERRRFVLTSSTSKGL